MFDIRPSLASLLLAFLAASDPAGAAQDSSPVVDPVPVSDSLELGIRALERLDPERELLALHARLIRAHRERRVDLWMSMEAEEFVSVNAGRVSFPDVEARRSGRTSYLESTDFHTYRDVRPPVAKVSEDGTLGWVVAEVRIAGSRDDPEGERVSFDEIWAWVELYEKTSDGWRLVGNSSSRRPDEDR